jgi:integrase
MAQDVESIAKESVHIRGVIARRWKFAMYAEIVPRDVNPMDFLEIPGASKSRTRKPRSRTAEEFEKFLEKTTEEPYRTMTLICISLGLRISETLGLSGVMLIGWTALYRFRVESLCNMKAIRGNTKTEESESKLSIISIRVCSRC